MDDIRNGKVYAAVFVFFLVVLIVGGYYLTIKLTTEDDTKKEETNKTEEKEEIELSDALKINKDKEYIYFENSDSKSLEHEMVYQDIVININSNEASNIAQNLNNEMSNLRKTFKKISEQEISKEDEEKILYKEDDIYSSTFKKYTRYFYKNYASLLSEEYDYDCFNGSVYKGSKSYVFDTNTGKLLSKEELLNLYDKNLDRLKSIVKEKLEKEQTVVGDVELIDITTTLKNLENNEEYALYINKSGFLTISYLVKTTQIDYNDVIIIN